MPLFYSDDAPPLGPGCVAGQPGYHYPTVAAFLTPLSVGTHTITAAGSASRSALAPFGGSYAFTDTYAVNVVPPGRCRR